MNGWLDLAFNAQSRAMIDSGFTGVKPWVVRLHWRIWRQGAVGIGRAVTLNPAYKLNCNAFEQYPELFK
jgi:hypothetical protein